MTKVGLATFHWANNFGAVLQTYALQQAVIKLGHDCQVIDYNPCSEKRLSLQKSIGRKISIAFGGYRRQMKFDNFRKKYLNLSKKYDKESLYQTPPHYDIYIAGSDQIWDMKKCNNTTAYFLDFVPNSLPKIAYAASLKKVSDLKLYGYTEKITSGYSRISVREKNTMDYLASNSGIQCTLTLDPVFLISKEEWFELICREKNKYKDDSYILVYYMEEDLDMFDKAIKLARETNKQVIYLKGGRTKYSKQGQLLKNVGPANFLSLIKGASYVCTNSFHGTAFSIIFGKNFMVAGKEGENMRIDNILSLADLKNKYLNNICYNNMVNYFQCDHNKSNSTINSLISQSKEFLFSCIKENSVE